MGKESMQWYNSQIMVGNLTDKTKWEGNHYVRWSNGKAQPWWQNEDFNMGYDGFIPVDDIRRRLFNFELASAPIWIPVLCDSSHPEAAVMDGDDWYRFIRPPDYRAIYRADSEYVIGVITELVVDQFDRTLIGGAAAIYDVGQHELGIGSAGLLRGGAVAWISMELPEAVQTPEGFTYRPTATLIDSYNGQFKFGVYYYKISVVCDNGLLETQNRANLSYTRKHTSRLDIAEARSALKVFWKNDEEFQKQIKALAQWEVTNKQFKAVMDEVVPMPAPIVDDGKVKNQRSITNAETKRAELEYLWVDDIRAATWNGTALGVWQAFNTWDTHFSQIRGSTDSEGNKIEANRTQRNMLRVARGYQMENDTLVLDTLATVCDVDLSEVFAYN